MTRKDAFGAVCDFLYENSGKESLVVSEEFSKARELLEELDAELVSNIFKVVFFVKNNEADVSVVVKKK
jgi:hypothetical protein